MSASRPAEKASAESSPVSMPTSPALPAPVDTPDRKAAPIQIWTRRRILIALLSAITILVFFTAIVAGVFGLKANAYPKYWRINYTLVDAYTGDGFFDDFDYFTGYDPTHGFVHYVDAEGSVAQGLTHTNGTDHPSHNGTAILRVDTSDKNATTGRRSVRISSKKTYSSGLFVFDVLHSPYGCGTWPALWLSDLDTWPTGGEIDVMETVNVGDTGNHMTLHTTDNCKIGKHRRRKQTGRALSYDCHNTTNYNEGCGVAGPVGSSGEAFNANGGGVYAVEVRKEGIRMWMFPRNDIPSDIRTNSPDPKTWGLPLADFPDMECHIPTHFKDMKIIANINLCGDWAGQQSVFGSNSVCTGNCYDWVATNASSFEEAYWEFNGFWVYDRA